MKKEHKEILDKDACPCGSGKKYEKCCKKKKIKYYYDGDKLIKEMPLNNETVAILKQAEEEFLNLYGRKPDKKGDFVFPFSGSATEDGLLEQVYYMRLAGIPEEKIYATYRCEGLLPTKENIDMIPEIELQEFENYRKEFKKLMKAPLKKKANALQLVACANDTLTKMSINVSQKLNMTLNDYIRRHSREKGSIRNYEIKTINDYCIFLALKSLKILDGISTLQHGHLADCVHSLSRNLFESYMYINAINNDKSFFCKKISPKIDTTNFTFDIKKDGSINYKKVIHNQSGEKQNVDVKIFELMQSFDNEYDHSLYKLFYNYACKYVHTDILSAQFYFNAHDPYDEIDPTLIAVLIALSNAVLLVDKISKASKTQKQYKEDAGYLLKKIKKELIICFKFANSDPIHKNEVFEVYIKRLELI